MYSTRLDYTVLHWKYIKVVAQMFVPKKFTWSSYILDNLGTNTDKSAAPFLILSVIDRSRNTLFALSNYFHTTAEAAKYVLSVKFGLNI